MMFTETRLDAQWRVTAANGASESWARLVPESSTVVKISPKQSPPKFTLPVGTEEVSKDLERTKK